MNIWSKSHGYSTVLPPHLPTQGILRRCRIYEFVSWAKQIYRVSKYCRSAVIELRRIPVGLEGMLLWLMQNNPPPPPPLFRYSCWCSSSSFTSSSLSHSLFTSLQLPFFLVLHICVLSTVLVSFSRVTSGIFQLWTIFLLFHLLSSPSLPTHASYLTPPASPSPPTPLPPSPPRRRGFW